ncbi:hypothetical protein [Thiorhodococcus minor]|uniref:RHS repeat protein n=1 Tax=Thiorhodococcus minor TaxID=57489 RepID=A0A6M0K9B6_9GAMM|nr:hypothetical protein [Thiorhodococcus minor]NEV65297.1 hypothetical protein [Thiorhodococcus minor]
MRSETNARGFTTAYDYDGINRPTRILPPIHNPVTVRWNPTSREVIRGALS